MLDPRTTFFEPSFMHSCIVRKLVSGELVAIVGGMDVYLLTDHELEAALADMSERLNNAARMPSELASRPKAIKPSLDDLELDI